MSTPSRADLLAAMRNRSLAGKTTGEDDSLSSLIDQIRKQRAIPILSDSTRLDRLFAFEDISPLPAAESFLREAWAGNLEYPFPTQGASIAHLAQYNLVVKNEGDNVLARSQYLEFLKGALLTIAGSLDADLAQHIEEEDLAGRAALLGFAELVKELDYPQLPPDQDCLRLLARLPFPVYITTSPFPFLQQALAHERPGAEIRTQICMWKGRPLGLKKEHEPDPNLELDPERPLVYHLFGHEAYPSTMVLSEDDHLEYLMAFSARYLDQKDPIIPHYLREALVRSSLLLLGFRLQGWDFRVLFRALRHLQRSEEKLFRMVIHLDPIHMEDISDAKLANEYLKEYFKQETYTVKMGDTESFIQDLWRRWQQEAGK